MSENNLDVLISFDMESDIGSWTNKHTGCAEAAPHILEILDKYNIRSTFFYTGDAITACPETAIAAKEAGHEIGCHTLHHESMGPALVDVPGVLPILPEEMPNRIKKVTDLIRTKCGVRPVTFRAPRGWACNEAIKALDELGYIADSSYMAGYYRKFSLPYHPSSNSWIEEGDMKILEVPLFGGDLIDKDMQTNTCWRTEDPWIVWRLNGAEALIEMIMRERQRQRRNGKSALVCLYFHPWEFVQMPKVIDNDECRIEFADFLWKNTGQRSLDALEALIKSLKNNGACFHTVKNFAELWMS